MRKTKKLIVMCLLSMIGIEAGAYDVEVDGIYYEIRAERAFVFGPPYVEVANIQSMVTYEGHVYSVVAIGDASFSGDENLREVNLPNTIGTIGESAFSGCTNLTNIMLPISVWEIKYNAFQGSGLTSIVIPYSVSSLSGHAFTGCSNLKSIDVVIQNPYYSSSNGVLYTKDKTTLMKYPMGIVSDSFEIPYGVETISDYAFCDGVHLREVAIPSSVTSIGDEAFMGCGATDYLCYATTPPTLENSSSFNAAVATVHVLEGYKDVYTSNEEWRKLTIVDDIPAIPNFISVSASGSVVRKVLSYDDDAFNTVTLTDGYKSLEVTEDIPLKQIVYSRTFNNTNWQALYVPFEIPVTAGFLENFEVAYINNVHQYDDDDDGTIDRTIVEFFKMKTGTLKANYPYVIKARSTGTKVITVNEATLYATEENGIDCRSTQFEYAFKGIYSRLTQNELADCFAMSGGGWKALSAGSYLNAFRIYLQITPRESGTAPLKSIGMRFIGEDGDVTEISSPVHQEEPNTPLVFDLQGNNVDYMTKGIYIVNGKKVVVK